MRDIAISVSVYLSVREHISKTRCLNFTKFSVDVTRWRASMAVSQYVQYVIYFWFCG